MRMVEIELSALRLQRLIDVADQPGRDLGDQRDHDQRQQRDDRAAEDHQQQHQDQHERGQQHDLLGPLAGLLAVELLGRRPGDALGQPGSGHQRLDVGAQDLDRVTGRRPRAVDHAVGHGDQRRLHQAIRRRRAGCDAHDVSDMPAVQRRGHRGDLRGVGGGQPPVVGAGEHDDRGGAGHLARLRERLVLQVSRPGSTRSCWAGSCFRWSWSAGPATVAITATAAMAHNAITRHG